MNICLSMNLVHIGMKCILKKQNNKIRFFKHFCSSTVEHYDIVVSGGGMVGAAMAAALGKAIFTNCNFLT